MTTRHFPSRAISVITGVLFSLIAAGALLKPTVASATVNLQFYTSPSLSVSANGVWGQSVQLNVSVVNRGTTASGAFQVSFYLENTDGSNPVFWTYASFPSIASNSYYGYTSATATLPQFVPSGLSSGLLRVQAVISQNNATASAGNINVTAPLPDLVGYDSSPDYFNVQQTSATWGSTIGVNYEVADQTAGNAGPFTVGIYIAKTNNFSVSSTNCYLIQTISFSSGLNGGYIGGSNGSYVNIQLPSVNPFGDSSTTFYVGMIVNPDHAVTESNYANDANQGAGIDSNASTVTITPPQPSISVTESTPPGNNNAINFGSVAVDGTGGALGTQTVTVTDLGLGPLSISSIATSGAPFQISNVVSNIQNISFSGAVPTSTVSNFFPSQMQSDGAESWVVTVTYNPTVTGTQTGTLTINSNDPNHAATTISLSGTGVPVPQLSFLDPFAPYNNLNANFGGIANDGAGGIVATGTFTLSNIGSGPLTVNQGGISLTDTGGGVWSITSITSSTRGTINLSSTFNTIAAAGAETWSVVVKFDPIANTTYMTGLQVSSNDPNSPVETCSIQGAGLIPMTLNVTDSIGSPTDHAMNFGSLHATGKQIAQGTVTLSNTGQMALALPQNAITLSDTSDFQITSIQSSTQGNIALSSSGSTIAPNGAEIWTVSLSYAPVTTGTLSGQLTIQSNDPAHASVPVALSGIGLNQPGISVSGSSGVQFGPILNDGLGNRIGTQTITIQDIGLQALSIPRNGISVLGTTFSIQSIVSSTHGTIGISSSAATIAANQAETWTVTGAFDPTANIAYTGTVAIQSNDPVTPTVNVATSGSGCQPTITLQPQTSGSTLYIPAGQPYYITWTAAYPPGTAQISLYWDTDTNPASGLILITGSLPFTTGSSYAWLPDASLVGQEFYLYGTIQDGSVVNGSYSAQKVHIEAAGSFNLMSALETASPDYAYQYVYNGKVYTGTAQLQPGANVITIVTPLPGGGNAVHKITVTEVPSLLAVQGYTYDEMNRIKTYTNGNGIVTTYTYDLAGDLIQTAASNGNTVTYTYDSLKRKTSMTDSTGTTFYDYDDLDRLQTVTYSKNAVKGDSDDLPLKYVYDNNNRLFSITYPGGEEVDYGYDNAGRMTSAKDITTGQNTTYGYNYANGLLSSGTLANGIVAQYGYNNMGQLNDIKYLKTSGTLAEYNYVLNSLGNASALLTTFPDGTQKQELYYYDTLDRLNEVVYGSNATAHPNTDKTVYYSYDGNGNRLTQTTVVASATTQVLTYTYGSQNQLQQVTDQTGNQVLGFVYDQAGNRIQKITPTGNTYYSYDERNLLTSVVTPTDYVLYFYNGAGQRVGKTVDGVNTAYVVDPSQSVYQVVQERTGGAISQSYIYGMNRLIANPVGGTDQFLIPDRLGSIRVVTDSSKNVLYTFSYDVFGAQQ
jgi:YD repeat-containing protein